MSIHKQQGQKQQFPPLPPAWPVHIDPQLSEVVKCKCLMRGCSLLAGPILNGTMLWAGPTPNLRQRESGHYVTVKRNPYIGQTAHRTDTFLTYSQERFTAICKTIRYLIHCHTVVLLQCWISKLSTQKGNAGFRYTVPHTLHDLSKNSIWKSTFESGCNNSKAANQTAKVHLNKLLNIQTNPLGLNKDASPQHHRVAYIKIQIHTHAPFDYSSVTSDTICSVVLPSYWFRGRGFHANL